MDAGLASREQDVLERGAGRSAWCVPCGCRGDGQGGYAASSWALGTMSWLTGYRRLNPRFERHLPYLAFLKLAAALCCYKRLLKLTT